MKNFMKAKTMIAVVCMVFFILACGTALAKHDETTAVHVSFAQSIWQQDFGGTKATMIALNVFDKDNHVVAKGVLASNTGKVLSLDTIATASAGATLKAHIAINADSAHNLKKIDVLFKNDGKDKNFVLEDLLAGK